MKWPAVTCHRVRKLQGRLSWPGILSEGIQISWHRQREVFNGEAEVSPQIRTGFRHAFIWLFKNENNELYIKLLESIGGARSLFVSPSFLQVVTKRYIVRASYQEHGAASQQDLMQWCHSVQSAPRGDDSCGVGGRFTLSESVIHLTGVHAALHLPTVSQIMHFFWVNVH